MSDLADPPPDVAAPPTGARESGAVIGDRLPSRSLFAVGESFGPFEIALAAIVLIALLFAFVGLASSSFFVDELFSLYLIDHKGGAAEVLRRTLTDTGPPVYYLLLHAWSKLAGLSEVAMRAPSAVCAVAAILVFVFGLRDALSLRARLFAAAAAVAGRFWFIQGQSARSYALCLLISAGLIVMAQAFRRRTRTDRPAWPAWTGLTLLALTGCLIHFYLALEAGLVVAFLILTTGGPRMKAALIASGLACVLATAAYSTLLLGRTQQDVHHMWFGSDARFLILELLRALRGAISPVLIPVVIALGLGATFRRLRSPSIRPAQGDEIGPDLIWLVGLAAFVLTGIVALGIGVSLTMAPSFSERNLLVAVPMGWVLWAALFTAGAPDLKRTGQRLVAVLIVAALGVSQVFYVEGRFLPRIEEWRASARFVDSQPACDRQLIPTLALQTFGPHTPHFLSLEEQQFYGRYERAPERLHIYLASDFGARDNIRRARDRALAKRAPPPPTTAEIARARPDLTRLMHARIAGGDGACPVLAWAVHVTVPGDIENLRQSIAASVGASPAQILVKPFSHFKLGLWGWRPASEAYVLMARRG